MVKLRNFTVEIVQKDDEDKDASAKEYDDRNAEDPEDTTTKYVAIKEDKSFSIKFSVDQDFKLQGHDDIWVQMTIDGQHKDFSVYQKQGLKMGQETVKVIDGFLKNEEGRQILRLFWFEETTIRHVNPEESLDELRQQFVDQGSIHLHFSWISGYSCPSQKERVDKVKPVRLPKGVVKERGSKSRASFDPKASRTAKFTDFVSSFKEPLMATFRFKYRTIGMISARSSCDQGIVSRMPNNTWNTAVVIADEQEESDPRAELEKLKREHEVEVGELRQQIKEERAENFKYSLDRKRKILPTYESGEIDLTEERPAYRRKPNADDVVVELDN